MNVDWNGWSKLKQGKPTNSPCTSRRGRKLDPTWKYTSRRGQDVIWLLSGNSTSPIFRVLICKLICGWQRQAWVWERILDVIRCLTPSWFVDWSLIGKESAAFPLWGRQGRWQLEHMDREWVSVIFLYNIEVPSLCPAEKKTNLGLFLCSHLQQIISFLIRPLQIEWNILQRHAQVFFFICDKNIE